MPVSLLGPPIPIGALHRPVARWANPPLTEALYSNMGRLCNNSQFDTLISKQLSAENKAKLSTRNYEQTILPRRCFEFPVERVAFCSLRFEISVSNSLLVHNLPLLVERVSLCSLHKMALKLVGQICYCYTICPC